MSLSMSMSMDMLRAVAIPVLAIVLAAFYISRKSKKKGSGLPSPPGPPGLPFVGNLLQKFNYDTMYQLSKKYGPLMTLHLGSVPTLVVSSARMAKEIYKTNDLNFSDRPTMQGQKLLSYNGVDMAFARYSNSWREMKKFSTHHLFTAKRVQSFRPIRDDEISTMLRAISEIAATPDKLIEVSKMTLDFTIAVISRIAFGMRCDEDIIGKDKFKRIFTDSQLVLSNFYFADFFPLLGWVDRLNGIKTTTDRSFNDLDVLYQALIDEHLKPGRRESGKEDFIDIFLDKVQNNDSTVPLTIDTIKSVIMNLLGGGADSTTGTIVGGMMALLQYPEATKKAQEEIRRVIGNKTKVDEDDIQNLPYTRAFMKEAMRMYPPFPLLVPRLSTESCIIGPDADHMYDIKANTIVYVNAFAVGRDPEAYEKPLEFKPERFLERPDIDYRGHNFELIPFGAGRRRCPGMEMGAATSEIAIVNLLYAFDWSLPEGAHVDYELLPGLTMHRKNKLWVRPREYAGYRQALNSQG
ncbi:5-OH-xanthotoxin synthase-like [Apium graveolens]|uniref:5-OH-xanthotoxin synthase-like n=1 Tax=Apium graveolens TaxID=4045 RepID=UPI003D7A2183